MKIPNREINIFNMSMLDVVCGALGAFLIVTVVLFPSYQNKATVIVEEVGQAKQANARLREEIARARRAAEVPPRVQEMVRENRRIEQQLETFEQSEAAKPPSPGSVKAPPLLVWIAWRRPQLTKHFTVALAVIPVSEETTEADAQQKYQKDGVAGLSRLYEGENSETAGYSAPREKPHTVFDEGLEYLLVTDPKPRTWYVAYTVRERTDLVPNLAPHAVPVYGFAVYGNREVPLPEVSMLSRNSAILVGALRLDPKKGLRFEKIMAYGRSSQQ